MRGTRHRGHRRAHAALAILLWLLGVEVLPNLHLATHEADHTHETDGTIVRVTFDATHAHEDGTVHAHDDVERERDEAPRSPQDQLAIDEVAPGHAAGGIAHHARALHQPPPPLLAPIAVPRAEIWVVAVPVARLAAITAGRPTARGPPAV